MHKIITVLTLIAFTLPSFGQKYGYLNTQEIITSLPEVEVANKKIEALKDSLTQVAEGMITSLQTKYKELESKVNDISPKQLREEQAKLQQDELALQEFDKTSQLLIYNRTDELLNPIQERINLAIVAVAKEGAYDYIFDLSAGNVLYADESNNISPLIMAKLQ